jgi:hypothetical protein
MIFQGQQQWISLNVCQYSMLTLGTHEVSALREPGDIYPMVDRAANKIELPERNSRRC